MPCPFPGMDPYIERPAPWPDFHDSLIAALRGVLQPLLQPKYAALTQDRLYVVETDRTLWPDVAVVRASGGQEAMQVATALAECDAPAVFPLLREEVRQPYLTIVEPAAGRASNRYRIAYVPFVTAMTRPGWAQAPGLGQGPDFFPRLLAAARRTLPDREAIPGWLVWSWPAAWALLLVASGAALARASRSLS